MIKQSLLLVTALIFSHISTASTSDAIKISSFKVGRTGGGQFIAVTSKIGDKVQTYVESCNFHQLSVIQQRSTRFELVGNDGVEAKSILDNSVIFASQEQLEESLTGSWSYFALDYVVFDHQRNATARRLQEIPRAIVLIGNVRTDVASRIEILAREKSHSMCDAQE